MSNISTLLKENYDLKNELESMIMRVKENETKHNGFKVVEFSMLLSDNFEDIDNKPMQYIEEIFDIERAVLFLKKDAMAVAQNYNNKYKRIRVIDSDGFSYTFLDSDIRSGTDKSIIHKDFQLMPSDVNYSYILVPVTDNGRIVAALGFYSQDKNRFSSDYNFDFVEEFALIASIALKKLDNAFLLEMQANTDYLTALPNKFIFDLTGKSSFEDLNNYKYINDKFGHLAGDEILKIISYTIRNQTGDYDILGRFGGDEFYLFTEITDKNALHDYIVKIQNAVEEIVYEENESIIFGFSGGAVIANERDFESFEDIVRLADTRLYEAKTHTKKENGISMESVIVGI